MIHSRTPPGFFYLLAVLLVIFLLGLTGVFEPVRRLAEKRLIIPIRQKIFDWRRPENQNSDTCSAGREKEITELKAKVAFLEEETKAQKRLLSSPLPKAWQFQTVKVIGAENETLIVSAGGSGNVKKGMVALSGDTYLGKVYRTSEDISVIRLPSFLDEKLVIGIISEKNRSLTARGLLVGRGEGGMRIDQILLSENVSVGDIVRTDVLGTSLTVGIISEVIEKKDEMFKSASVKRQYDPRKLETIFLIKK